MKILLGYTLTYSYIIIIIIVTTYLHKKHKIKEKVSRKLIHISVGFSWFIMAYFFKTSYHLIIPPLSFIIINYISYKKDLISSLKNIQKKSYGTIFYALSFMILALITYYNPKYLPYYGLSVLTMALADGLAPLIGAKFSTPKILKTNKTYSGSLTIFLITILIIYLFKSYYNLELSFLKIIIISISAVLLELIDYKGSDNLSLPLGTFLISVLLTL